MPTRTAGPQSPTLVFNFTDVPDYCVSLDQLSQNDQSHLFRIISRYVPQRLLSTEVLFMQMKCLVGQTPDVQGFTSIWSEEFDRKFELANHVCLVPGQLVGNGRYSIEMTIATRMSSSTYLALDGNEKAVVIKELVVPVNADESVEQKLLRQFDREAAILASLSNPSIVTVLDHFVENSRSYLVMEYVSGENLRQYVRSNGPLRTQQLVSVLRQLLDVLEFMHRQDPPVLHRDLTPDNIIYNPAEGTLKVIDFGASTFYDDANGTCTLIGKQGYMPPEQYKGKPTPASDIYALGSTLLFAVAGTDPPGLGRCPTLPDQTDRQISELIQSCIEFEQEKRPSIDELRLLLASIIGVKESRLEIF